MIKITESDVEDFAIALLEKQGYVYLSPEQQDRENLADVVLRTRLKTAIDKLNPHIPADENETEVFYEDSLPSPLLICLV